MINSKSAKIKIIRIKGKVHSLTSKIYYKLQKSREEKTRKVKPYNYFFFGWGSSLIVAFLDRASPSLGFSTTLA